MRIFLYKKGLPWYNIENNRKGIVFMKMLKSAKLSELFRKWRIYIYIRGIVRFLPSRLCWG